MPAGPAAASAGCDAVNTVKICILAVAIALGALGLVAGFRSRIFHSQAARMGLSILCVNLVFALAHLILLVTLCTEPHFHHLRGKRCPLEMVSNSSFYGMLFVQTAIVGTTVHLLRKATVSLLKWQERVSHGIAYALVACIAIITGVECFQCPDDEEQFAECHYTLIKTMEWVWLGLSIVPVSLFVVMIVLARRAVVAARVTADDDALAMNDIQRRTRARIAELRQQAIRETYLPLRWFPAVFVVFIPALLHPREHAPEWDVLFTVKTLLDVFVFYTMVPGSWKSVKRLVKCGNPNPYSKLDGLRRHQVSKGRRNRQVRVGEVTVIGEDVDYIPLEDAASPQGGETLPEGPGDEVVIVE